MSTTLIASRDPQGLEIVRQCEVAVNEVRMDSDGAQRVIERAGEFKAYVAAGLRRFSAPVPNYDTAREILGNDFIAPEEIMTARGLVYSDDQLVTFGQTLPSQEALEWCRDNGMMLVAGPPSAMSLLDVRANKPAYFYTKEGGWYSGTQHKFATQDKANPVWIAIRKEPMAGSLAKNWPEQSALVTEPMVVPNAAEMVWGLTTYMAVRNVYLLPGVYVRTSSVDSDGDRVDVGHFDAGGLYVYNDWDDHRYGHLGVASARKF